MNIKDRMNKFDDFLTKFAQATGDSKLCESVREAAKVCFEGLENKSKWMEWMKQDTDDPYKKNGMLTYRDIHRIMFHKIPRERVKKLIAAKKASEAGTDVPVDEVELTK